MPISDNAATFLGISNENEFYSAHYLAEVFKGDISEQLNTWKQQEEQAKENVVIDEQSDEQPSKQQQAKQQHIYQAPYNRLKGLAREYFFMRERSQRERHQKKATAMQREFFKALCGALDFPWEPTNVKVSANTKTKQDVELPVLSTVSSGDGAKLWVLGALDVDKEGIDPLLLELKKDQFIGAGPHADSLKNTQWYQLINDVVFKQEEPPRWVLLLSDRQAILIDRFKWLQNRLLRFDWDEILGRKDDITLKASAALLHQQSLVPEQGASLLDNLDENSHKHAFGVSEDLKYALREAIELLGNEAAAQLIQRKDIAFTGKTALDADKLSRECLRYMYRLLFLFYIEARPELNYLPQTEVYLKGYSLDALRDLELVKLTTDESRKGYYFYHSINKLFDLIHQGYQGDNHSGQSDAWEQREHQGVFTLKKLDSHLFDPKLTPYLNKVKFSNQVLQRIICLMSLTRETSGRGRKRRGRVSYAQLGINQLGAVYEALLSYRGFFASVDLYEVKKAKENADELETGYFVTAAEVESYEENERVYIKLEKGGKALKMHPRGKFIYRLAGRDRQKSASYYTPEVLTKCLVKYTLKERLTGLTADEIIDLTICEPAMGSAAFLNEAVNQLAEAYLTLKQEESDKRIPHEEYREALQQVKMHIADHNVYGVDLNPIAVELAEVSLWLNALSQSNVVPWFGYQLFDGNSLIGARRQVYGPDQILAKSKEAKWFKQEPIRLDPLKPERDAEHVYHFLLPDEGMAGVNDKEAKKLRPDAFAKIKNWKKVFLKPFELDELSLLQQISKAVDSLWLEHTNMLRADRNRTEDRFNIWGQDSTIYHTSTEEKDQIRAKGIFNHNAKIASPYRRLKLVMDYWCALWFWPLDQVDLLPDRSTWLFELNLLLQGEVFSFQPEQGGLFGESNDDGDKDSSAEPMEDLFSGEEQQQSLSEQEEKAQQVKTAKGELYIEKLLEQFPRLKLAHELAEKFKFFHWELTFADVFADRGGFDVMLGNPPWLKVEWNEGGVLGDFNPQFVLRKLSATQLRQQREAAFERNPQLERNWFSELEEAEGTQNYLNATQNYFKLKGIQTNLYKCFLILSSACSNNSGVYGFINENGIFDDPKGSKLRRWLYSKLKYHFQFFNELNLFDKNGVAHDKKFCLNIFSNEEGDVSITSISNLFHPKTIDQSFGNNSVPEGMLCLKSDDNWNLMGDEKRIININIDSLKSFFQLYDKPENVKGGAVLPQLQVGQFEDVLKRISKNTIPTIQLVGDCDSTSFWDQTNAEKKLNVIRKEVAEKSENQPVIYVGSMIFVGNPIYKIPERDASKNSDFTCIDVYENSKNFDVRTPFVVVNQLKYSEKEPRVSFSGKKFSTYYKLAYRNMTKQVRERSLVPAILPPDTAHTNGIRSIVFQELYDLIDVCAFYSSLVADFYIKTTGKENLHTIWERIPIARLGKEGRLRVLLLNCLNSCYEVLWSSVWDEEFMHDSITIFSNNSIKVDCSTLTKNAIPNDNFRTDIIRRYLLLELDVLAAIYSGITLNHLLSLYRVQFPVLSQYERGTYYDTNGRIIYTPNKGLVGVGLSRKSNKKDQPLTIEYPDGSTEEKILGWKDIAPAPAAENEEYGKPAIPDGTKIHRKVIDDTLPGGPREKTITYVAPFYLPNREQDYRTAWQVFTERFQNPITTKEECEA